MERLRHSSSEVETILPEAQRTQGFRQATERLEKIALFVWKAVSVQPRIGFCMRQVMFSQARVRDGGYTITMVWRLNPAFVALTRVFLRVPEMAILVIGFTGTVV
jgi:hypothetical protein